MSLWGRLLRREMSAAEAEPRDRDPVAGPQVRRSRSLLVDARTRTFWARGEPAAATVVDAAALPEDSRRGAGRRTWIDRERQADVLSPGGLPRGNPAFSEVLFVELMRAGQFERAFRQLSPRCQAAWGSVEAFTATQRSAGNSMVQGARVREVTYLDHWVEPDTGWEHGPVAELRVEYTLGTEGATTRVDRTVHLVPVNGSWRSLCPPQRS